MANKAYTFSDFSRLIDDDFTWRKNELFLFKTRIPDDKTVSFQKPLLRAGIAILYAHWEGFVKNASTLYLQHISFKHLKNSELQSQFVALNLSNKIKDLEINKLESKTKIINFLFDEYNKKSNIPFKSIINTKSNLKFDVFVDILFTLDIDSINYQANESLINDLVDLRNTIAHGEYKEIDYDTYDNFYTETTDLMRKFKTDIENAAVLQKYKKQIAVTF